jgi:hypothetical protein
VRDQRPPRDAWSKLYFDQTLTIALTTSNMRLPVFKPSCTASLAKLACLRLKGTSLPFPSTAFAALLRSYTLGAHQLDAMEHTAWTRAGGNLSEWAGGPCARGSESGEAF